MDAVREHLVPLGVKLPQQDREIVGGYFIWLRLPSHIRANLLARRCKDTHNLVIADGPLFEVPGDAYLKPQNENAEKDARGNAAPTAFPYDIRLCFAWEEEEALVEGVERLASVITSMLEEPEGLNAQATRRSFEQNEGSRRDISSFQ
jgi:DNA-binding transcriptional MocR family regulator